MKTSETQTPDRKIKSATPRSKSKKLQPEKTAPGLQSRIEVAAYYKAMARGFAPGNELNDWLAAEKEAGQ